MPKALIHQMSTLILVRGIRGMKYLTTKYAVINLYIDDTTNGTPTMAHIRRKAYIMPNLTTMLLIGINILAPEGVTLDFTAWSMTIASCENLTTSIQMSSQKVQLV